MNETISTEHIDVDHSREEKEMHIDDMGSEEEYENDSEDYEYLPSGEANVPQTFNQQELNDLIRDLGLPKDGAEYLAAAL